MRAPLTTRSPLRLARLTAVVATVLVAGAASLHAAAPTLEEAKNFWSWKPLSHPAVPAAGAPGAWKENPVDAFIHQKLAASGLKPGAAAPREVLIRRAYYDLTGLPPTPEAVAAFAADQSPDAWKKLIDQLLASQRYGEKWGRHWLDLARYAETNGFERDGFKDQIWRYRQYVIDSFNADKPYDQFIREQIAGDELDGAGPEQLTATGFLRLHQWDDEPADREQHYYDCLDDIVRTTSEVFLAATVGCARCHNHKVDPITQRDYYSLMAFFRGMNPYDNRALNLADGRPAQPAGQKKKITREIALQRVTALEAKARKAFAAKDPALKHLAEGPAALLPDSRVEPQKWQFTTTMPAADWMAVGYNPTDWAEGPAGFGRNGTPGAVVRTEWKTPDIWLRRLFGIKELPKALRLVIHHDNAAQVYLNGQLIADLPAHQTDYATVPLDAKALQALQTGRNVLAIHCHQDGGGQFIDAGLEDASDDIQALLQKRGDEIFNAKQLAEYSQMREILEKGEPKEDADEPAGEVVTAMVVTERGPKAPDQFIHLRGNAHVEGDKVQPAFPAAFRSGEPVLRPTDKSTGRRRALAEWIASPDNLRTSRVLVNRVWQHHFGRGLCSTSSDFGGLGSACSHPDLLDWLAGQFIDGGWKIKDLHRLLMLSRSYQLASTPVPDALAKDPQNELLWRFDMRRLTAEEVRDSVLTATGTLNLKYGGPSVFGELPAEVLATASHGAGAWGTSPPEERVRRSVYMRVKRSLLDPLMTDFDLADTDSSCPVRFTTTVPTQALNLLNSKFLNEQAALLAARLTREAGPDPAAQVARGLQLVTQRPAKPAEVQRCLAMMQTFQTGPSHLTPAQALERFCLVALNLNEAVFVD